MKKRLGEKLTQKVKVDIFEFDYWCSKQFILGIINNCSKYYNNVKFIPITNIPVKIPKIDKCSLPKERDIGSNSSSDI